MPNQTKPSRFRPLPESSPTRELLLRVYAFGSVATTQKRLHPWVLRGAEYALRSGLVELAFEDPLYLAMVLDDPEALVVRLAPAGRARLGLPDPEPLGDRDPLEVIRTGVRLIHGCELFRVSPPHQADGSLLASAPYDPHPSLRWELNCISRFATEQGVPCRCVFSSRGALTGFAAIEGCEIEPGGLR